MYTLALTPEASRREKHLSMRVMFLDESGDHKLTNLHKSRYPFFALGGVIIDRAYLREIVEPDLNDFKTTYFGRTDVVLHTVNMRNGGGDYDFLSNVAVRTAFYTDLNALLAKWEYKVIGCGFDKVKFVARYGNPIDPYHYSLDILVERFCNDLGGQLDDGFICAEKRGGSLDHNLLLAWENLRTGGIESITARDIDCRIVGMDLRDKTLNLTGLQLADLIVTPIGRHVAGFAEKPFQIQWSIVESKLRRHRGSFKGSGLVIRP